MPGLPAPFAVESSTEDGQVLIAVTGEVDTATAPPLREALRVACARERPDVWVDLCGVEFMDSSGLGVLIAAHREIVGAGGRLAIVCPPGAVRLLFEVLGVQDSLPLYASRGAARRGFSRRSE